MKLFVLQFNFSDDVTFFDRGGCPGNTYTKNLDRAMLYDSHAAIGVRLAELAQHSIPTLYSDFHISQVTVAVVPEVPGGFILSFPGEGAWDNGGEPGCLLTWTEEGAKTYLTMVSAVERVLVIVRSGIFPTLYGDFDVVPRDAIPETTSVTIDDE